MRPAGQAWSATHVRIRRLVVDSSLGAAPAGDVIAAAIARALGGEGASAPREATVAHAVARGIAGHPALGALGGDRERTSHGDR